jgi:hypothetical protein
VVYQQTVRTVQGGQTASFLQLAAAMAPFLERAGYKFLGMWQTTIGNMYEFTMLLAADSLAQIEKSYAFLVADQEYMDLTQKMNSISTSFTSKIMRPTLISPMK